MISLSRLRLMLGITTTDDDLLLAELLDGAVAAVGTETNRYFGLPAEHTEYRQGNDTKELPLLSIPTVGDGYNDFVVIEQEAPGLNVTLITETAADGYELRRSPRAARLQRAGGYLWRWGFEYVVTYEHGWNIDALPPDIERVVVELVGARYLEVRGQAGQTFGLRSETFDNYSYTKFGPADLARVVVGGSTGSAILDAWREPVLV